jgi:phosphoribosylamine--glycine ligase
MPTHNILLLGSGGRESALAWKLRQSPLCENLFIAPGNGGTAQYGTNLPFAATDFQSIRTFCIDQRITMVLPGPEDPLVQGIYDFFMADEDLAHIIVAGPSKDGAQLEGSKAFSKKFMARHSIPTASYMEFDKHSFIDGVNYLKQHSMPVVIKADGLAAGKGVIIAQTAEEAIEAFTGMIREEQFGAAGHTVVVEEFLEGIELSVFALVDGLGYAILPEAKDYKRIGEGDTGPNTGGMGAISPVPFADAAFMEKVIAKIIEPTVSGLAIEQIVYSGFIFFGLIRVGDEPYVIEYNCRMGDPETEVVMPRLENDLVELLEAMSEYRLEDVVIRHSPKAACTVMLVSEGYPGSYAKGAEMNGIDGETGSLLFHAGTSSKNGATVTSGGRVLAITSLADTLSDALKQSYRVADKVSYTGKHFRRDIGYEFKQGS